MNKLQQAEKSNNSPSLKLDTHIIEPVFQSEYWSQVAQKARINPRSLSSTDVSVLQRTIGNQATQRLIQHVHSPKMVSNLAHAILATKQIPDTKSIVPREELAHMVQQRGGASDTERLEQQADLTAEAATALPRLSPAGPDVQRRISIRDVGRGEQSGMARLDEFLALLNEVSTGLTFSVEEGWLTASTREGATLSEFDRQMQRFIADAADIRMRMTNRHGLMGERRVGFNWGVEVDSWLSGYVDIDDLLASSPSGFMTSLVHLLRERQRTTNYTRRIGTPSLDASQPGPAAEFRRAHGAGLDAELQVLRDLLQDPSVRFIDRDTRLLRNDRGDRIRERMGSGAGGNHAIRWVVVLHHSGRVLNLEEYIELLERERTTAQSRRERLGGATEHRVPGGSVPAP